MEKKESEMNKSNRSPASMNLGNPPIKNWTSLIQSNKDNSNNEGKKQKQQITNKWTPGNSDAIFLGWQRISSGGAFALYNVMIPYHPLYGSTVSERMLQKWNLRVPATPKKIG